MENPFSYNVRKDDDSIKIIREQEKFFKLNETNPRVFPDTFIKL